MFRALARSVAGAVIAVLAVSSPANAVIGEEPQPELSWHAVTTIPPLTKLTPSLKSRTSSAAPRIRRPSDTPRQRAAAVADFKSECQARSESRRPEGWVRSRFEQCFIGSRTINLLSRKDGVVTVIATMDVTYSLLAFSVDGSRRVDYVFDFDDFDTKGGEPLPVTTLTVAFSGCAPVVVCSSDPPSRADLVPDWKTGNRLYQFSITSPDDTGDGTYKIVRGLVQMDMAVVTAAPNILPWSETAMASSRSRFDSARSALGQGKFHGVVFSDFVPTAEFDRRAGSDHAEEARHIDDALHAPQRTFPSFANKSVPGEGTRPLHRLMNETLKGKNTDAAVRICVEVWGPEYPSDKTKQCDEYPFKTTYEGAATSTGATEANPNGANESRWQGSARPIGKDANEKGGNHLGLFYGQNRVLDENVGTDQQGKPSEPFFVKVLK